MSSVGLVCLLVVLSFAPPDTPPAFAPSREAAPREEEPSLKRVQTAAVRRAQLDPARARRWLRDAHRAALLPQLDLSWEHRYDRGWQHDIEPGVPDELETGHDATDVWRVKATWKLDRLWFNVDELRASRAQADLARWREELLTEVTRLYFDRLRATATAHDPGLSWSEREEATLTVRQIEGLLEAMTGLSWPRSASRTPIQGAVPDSASPSHRPQLGGARGSEGAKDGRSIG